MDNDLLAGNMPPQDISAEKAILGAVFLNPEALADVMEQVEPDDFYSRQHQILFQSMIELNDADQPIDVLTMKSSLETKNQLMMPAALLTWRNWPTRFLLPEMRLIMPKSCLQNRA